MFRRLLTLLFLVFIPLTSAFSQRDIEFEFDFAQFKYDSTSTYIEFYYAFKQADLQLVRQDNGYLISGKIHIKVIKKLNDELFIDRQFQVNAPLQDTTGYYQRNLIGVFGMIIPDGEYSLTVTGSDVNYPDNKLVITENLSVDADKYDELSISDIQLSTNIKNSGVDTASIFYKNTLEVLPNPSYLYSHQSPVLFFYSEIYNTAKEGAEDDLKVERILYNSTGKQVYKKSKFIERVDYNVVEIGAINLKKMPTDTYELIISIVDTTKNSAFVTRKKFFLYNPDVVDSIKINRQNLGYVGTEFGVMTMEEVNQMFDFSKFIASKNEQDNWKELDSLDAKRKFLYNFWQARDTDPATPKNEYKEAYLERVRFANEKFRTLLRPGYKTDRGRVYLIYGEPDQRERYPNEMDMKPYEVWYYNEIENGVYFVFADLGGYSDYELMHSTKRGEMIDENWRNRVYQY